MTTLTQPRPTTQDRDVRETRDSNDTVTKGSTCNLIASDKVEGTSVFDRAGEKIGTVRKIIIGKMDGRVHHVVMGFGGLFGMGENDYPLPWEALDYDTSLDGYRMKHLNKSDLDASKAPSYKRNQEPDFSQDFDNNIRNYYQRTAA